jgi:hypothetical protein
MKTGENWMGPGGEVIQEPDAEVIRWDEDVAITTPGTSIASYMDRLAAGYIRNRGRSTSSSSAVERFNFSAP